MYIDNVYQSAVWTSRLVKNYEQITDDLFVMCSTPSSPVIIDFMFTGHVVNYVNTFEIMLLQACWNSLVISFIIEMIHVHIHNISDETLL